MFILLEVIYVPHNLYNKNGGNLKIHYATTHKRIQIGKAIFEIILPDFKLYYKTITIKTS